VGDEVLFRPSSGQVVEGIVVDVGWYRTTIRSFEREIYMIPNSGGRQRRRLQGQGVGGAV
jgi:MscS family membrane protein